MYPNHPMCEIPALKRILIAICFACMSLCVDAQTSEIISHYVAEITKSANKGSYKRAIKYYYKASEIIKQSPDSLNLYLPLFYSDDNLITTMLECKDQTTNVLIDSCILDISRLWHKHLELLKNENSTGEFAHYKSASGFTSLYNAAQCAMATLDSLGDYTVPCNVFFDDAIKIGLKDESFSGDTEVIEVIESLLYIIASFYDDIYDDPRACIADINYFRSIIESHSIDSIDMEDIQRMVLMYCCTCDFWNPYLSEQQRRFIEYVIDEWAQLRLKFIEKFGNAFYDKIISSFLCEYSKTFFSAEFNNDKEIFGYYPYDCLFKVINAIRDCDLENIYSSLRLFLNSIDNPRLICKYTEYIVKLMDECGMGLLCFNIFDIIEEHFKLKGYNESYIVEIHSLAAELALIYYDTGLAKEIMSRYLNNISVLEESLTPNQYFNLIDTICRLYGSENNIEALESLVKIVNEFLDEQAGIINQVRKIAFYEYLAGYYKSIDDLANMNMYVQKVLDEGYFDGDVSIYRRSSSIVSSTLLYYVCHSLYTQEKYKEVIDLTNKCLSYVTLMRRNDVDVAQAYYYLIAASGKLKDYESQKLHYKQLYDFIVNSFYESSFSLPSYSREIMWGTYSECLEDASGRALDNKDLNDICFNLALLQKNQLLKYSNVVKNNIYNSQDSILIDTYEKLNLAQHDKLLNTQYYERQLMNLYSSHSEFRNSHQVYNWEDVRQCLGTDDLAIEFTVCYKENSNSYAALLLKRDWDCPKLIELCEESELKKLMKDGSKVYKENDAAYSCIWEKLEPYFKKGDNIYFAPHGMIHQLNIEVLCGADGKPMNKKCNVYRLSSTGNLVEEREDLKYTSATLYGGLNYDTDTTSMLAINRNYVATSSYQRDRLLDESVDTRAGWKYLPGTAVEVKNVGDILNEHEVTTTAYTGMVGTEESFKALSGNSTPIIHSATHGFYLEDKSARKAGMFELDYSDKVQTISPLKRAGLMFSGGQHAWLGREIPEGIDDGVLTADEIAGMNLTGTDLLVLSACQTGLGEITNEGVEGLQRGFKIAGVNTIIMSLWEVSDAATEVLMTKFYALLTKGKSKREAFDKAVEAVKKEYPSPEYWAAFIMLD